LRATDTPSICNAIEVVQGKRGFERYTRQTVLASDPSAKPIVGYAVTAMIAARKPPTEDPTVIRERRMAYSKMMAEARTPSVAVVEDADYPDCVGAYWGEVNTAVHRGFGMAGALTNGVMRDLGDMPAGFPVLAGSIGPSHAFVHVRAINVEVSVFGLTIRPGDLVHADRHGARRRMNEGRIRSLDINPLIAGPDGLVAVDALVEEFTSWHQTRLCLSANRTELLRLGRVCLIPLQRCWRGD